MEITKDGTEASKEKPISAARARRSAHVRFTADELRRITVESAERGLSIPDILKERYFAERAAPYVLPKEDQKEIVGQLGRIGNNVNQIAKRLNAGWEAAGARAEIAEVRKVLADLFAFAIGRVSPARG